MLEVMTEFQTGLLLGIGCTLAGAIAGQLTTWWCISRSTQKPRAQVAPEDFSSVRLKLLQERDAK